MSDDWKIKLPSGKVISAISGVIGIDANLNIYNGWDDDYRPNELTPGEKRELADRMIDLWTKYRDQK